VVGVVHSFIKGGGDILFVVDEGQRLYGGNGAVLISGRRASTTASMPTSDI
jgi:hypothetical protein